jgi:hypothetical protein
VAVLPPEQDPEAQAAADEVVARLESIRVSIRHLEAAVALAEADARSAAERTAAADRLLTRLENLERQFDNLRTASVEDAEILGLTIENLVSLRIDRGPLESARSAASQERERQAEVLNPAAEGSAAFQLVQQRAQLERITAELDEPDRRYQAHQSAVADWEDGLRRLIGTADTDDSETGLLARLADLDAIPDRLAEARARRIRLVVEIFESKLRLLAHYRRLFDPVQDFIESHPVAREQDALKFDASIVPNRTLFRLLDLVHQGRRGSFAGEREGHDRLVKLVDSADLETAQGVTTFVTALHDDLWLDAREMPARTVRLREQLRQDVEPAQVYDLIFGLDYLEPRFELTWNGRNLDQLSPGERGSLLLVFYLLIDLRTEPLIIDQPEENLDNETISALLIPAVRAARERRQLIMVTHNPNLAVVCDADQVIYARIERGAGNRITYTTGAIENPVITPHVVNVLEGTMPAFSNRGSKYRALYET